MTSAAGNRGLVLAAAGIALLLAGTLAAYRLPAPRAIDADPRGFSALRALRILKDVQGSGVAHPLGSAANTAVRDRILQQLSVLGYGAELQTGLVCNSFGTCGSPTNIIATRVPTLGSSAASGSGAAHAAAIATSTTEADTVLLAAHYDSVAAGPGASDDGAGVAAVIEIARALGTAEATRHPIALLITDGEEPGLLGAQLFVREHPLAKRVRAAVNLEARGTSGPSLMFETGSANSWLMRLYAKAIAMPMTNSLYYVVYKLLPNNTDFTVFKAQSYQGFNFAFIGNVGYYHTPLDNVANASAASIQHQGDNALQAVLALANASDLHPAPGESVFFDVLARALVVWPANVGATATFAALALLIIEVLLLLRRRIVRTTHILWGVLGVAGSLALSAALCLTCVEFLRGVGKVPAFDSGPWPAHPLPMSLAAAAIAVFASAASAMCLGRRAGFWGFCVASAICIAVPGALAAALIPGPSFLLVLTSVAAVLGLLPAVLSSAPPSRGRAEFAALCPGLTMFALLLPLLLMLYAGLGAMAWPLEAAGLSLAAWFLLPLLSQATARARLGVTVCGAVIAAAGVVCALLLPTFSAEWPQRMNVEYWLDADAARAHWWALPGSVHLPPEIAAAASFDATPRPRYVGSSALGFAAEAPTRPLPPPELRVVSVKGQHLELNLRSPRGAADAFVVFPASANIQQITVRTASGPLKVGLLPMHAGAMRLDMSGISADGLNFALDSAAKDLRVQVFDQSYGLPDELAVGKALQRARPLNATSSQDGDVTVVYRTVKLDPTAGR